MYSHIQTDTISMGLPILYFKVEFVLIVLILANSTDVTKHFEHIAENIAGSEQSSHTPDGSHQKL